MADRLSEEVSECQRSAAVALQGRGRSVDRDSDHSEVRRGARGERPMHAGRSARRYALDAGCNHLAAAGRTLEAAHVDRVPDHDVAEVEFLQLSGALVLEARGRGDGDLNTEHGERACSVVDRRRLRFELDAAVAVEVHDARDQDVGAVEHAFDLDFRVEGEIGCGAVVIDGRARGRHGLVGNIEVRRRYEAGDESFTLHLALIAGRFLIALFLRNVGRGQRHGRCIEHRALRFDYIAIAGLAAGEAAEIGARIVHDERVDLERVRGRIEACDASEDLQLGTGARELDARRDDVAARIEQAAHADDVPDLQPGEACRLDVHAEGSARVDRYALTKHRHHAVRAIDRGDGAYYALIDVDGLRDPRVVSVVLLGLDARRSEEHTSELQSQSNLVCRLLLEKKKKKKQRRQWSKQQKKQTIKN